MLYPGRGCCSMIAAIENCGFKGHIAAWLQQCRAMITTMWSHRMNVDPVRSSQVFLSSRQNYLSTVSLMNPDYNRVHIVSNSCLRTYLRRYMAKCNLREVWVSPFAQLSHFHSCVYVFIFARLSHDHLVLTKNEKTERSLWRYPKSAVKKTTLCKSSTSSMHRGKRRRWCRDRRRDTTGSPEKEARLRDSLPCSLRPLWTTSDAAWISSHTLCHSTDVAWWWPLVPKQACVHFFGRSLGLRWMDGGLIVAQSWPTWSSPPGCGDGALSECVITHNLRLHTPPSAP